VRLIEDKQHRSPLFTPQPRVIEHDRERLVAVREIVNVENGRIGTVGDDFAGCGMLAGPGLPLEQAQILDALRDRELARVVRPTQPADQGRCIEGAPTRSRCHARRVDSG